MTFAERPVRNSCGRVCVAMWSVSVTSRLSSESKRLVDQSAVTTASSTRFPSNLGGFEGACSHVADSSCTGHCHDTRYLVGQS